jgi:hypothetical protein
MTPQFQVTAEWDRTRFNFVNGDQDLDMYSLGVRYKFQRSKSSPRRPFPRGVFHC